MNFLSKLLINHFLAMPVYTAVSITTPVPDKKIIGGEFDVEDDEDQEEVINSYAWGMADRRRLTFKGSSRTFFIVQSR